MKIHEILNENVEDTHSEVYGDFQDLLKNITDPKEKSRLVKNMADAMDAFSEGYETDNDHLMYGALDEMKSIVSQMK